MLHKIALMMATLSTVVDLGERVFIIVVVRPGDLAVLGSASVTSRLD